MKEFTYIALALLVSLLWGSSKSFAQICFIPATNFATDAYPFSTACADFNGDGFVDLAVANSSGADVSILLGTGTGSFGTATNFSVGVGPQAVSCADFNGFTSRDRV